MMRHNIYILRDEDIKKALLPEVFADQRKRAY
jgi:hypothetical protein